MAIIAHYKSGECNIYIDDRYAVKTEEEKHQIMRNIGAIYARAFREGNLLEHPPVPPISSPDVPLIKQPLTARS